MLDAAAAVFAAEGFDRATMDMIATRSETTKPTLYASFGSKERLFQAAVEREYELLKERLFAVYGMDDTMAFRGRLHAWVAAYFDFARERPEGFWLISEGERHPVSAAIIDAGREAIVDQIATIVTRNSGRSGAKGARLMASMISGMLRSGVRNAVNDGEIDLARAAALCESLLYGAARGVDPGLIDAVG
jgi:AcrR family transcriptional regulator